MNPNNLKETIHESRPNLKPNTIKMYEILLNKLKVLFDTDDFKFLKNSKKVEEKLKEKLHYTSQRNYYNAIIILLNALDYDKDLIKEYQNMRDELNKKYEDDNASGKISDKQKANFVKIEEIHKMIKKMEDELRGKGYKKKTLSPKDKTLLQVYTIFNIHIILPMRNDLSGAVAIMKKQYNTLSSDEKKENNYLVVEKTNMWFVLNKFKTQKKYEELRFDVPKPLEKLLRMYLRVNGMGVLFTSSTGKPYSRNALTQLLTKYSQKYMGKSISTTMLRKIVLSDKFIDLKKEQEDMAKITGHSVETMNKVYVKEGQGNDTKSKSDDKE
tara:strand:+ start:195 stop:1175 length:981 start_codon:yes stop_codon:yes gene_type:complete